MDRATLFSIAQIIIVIFLIVTVLLQQKGVGLGSSFGGGDSVFTTRRGPEKMIFNATVGLSILFLGVSLGSFLLQ